MSAPEQDKAAQQRRTFVPVVLAGLAASGAAAVAGHQPMLRVPEDAPELGQLSFVGNELAQVEFPLAGALALVALASWGILLVTRGRARQVLAALAALAAGGVFAVLIVGGFVQEDDAAVDIADQLGLPALADRLPLESTPWYWIAVVAAVVAVVAAVSAVMLAPEWPEMGNRYDAPAAHDTKATDAPAEERTNLDLWKSMDEGDDPTTDPATDPANDPANDPTDQ